MSVSGKRVLPVVLGVVITAAIISSVFPAHRAYADQITTRSLTLQGVGNVGGSTPGGLVDHLFTFTAPNTGSANIGSISFKYCTRARDTSCVTPTAMDASGATLGTTTGITGWTIYGAGTNTNTVVIAAGTAAATQGALVVPIDNVKNPDDVSNPNLAFYVDISTYTSADGTGTPVDEGWVAAATANQIQLSGTMPESLVFCTGHTITAPSGIPDCSTAENSTVAFNQLFSPTDTATATSMMAASTNAAGGYVITENGPTLTQGSNTVTPMDDGSGGPTTSVIGKSQFGMNLAVNTTPAIGAVITPASNGTNLRAEPATHYATADNFLFKTAGDAVADSYDGGAGGTDNQLYTVSYMVNVDGAQTAGTYTATLTYICTSTF